MQEPKGPRTGTWASIAVLLAVLLIALATLRPWGGAVGTFCVRCSESWLGDVLLNVVLFMPLGFALCAAENSPARALWRSAAVSLCIEVLQYYLVSGRFSNPLDVVANSLGGFIGARFFNVSVQWLRGETRQESIAILFVGMWWIQCWGTAWALLPRVPAGPSYTGQWARVLPGFVPFGGRVLDAYLGSVQIPDGPVPDSALIRSLVEDSMLQFTVRTEGLPRAEPAALVAALVSGTAHRMASISLAGCRLQARSGTNSERIGLNTPRIAVDNACVDLPGEVKIVLRQDGKVFSVDRESPGIPTARATLVLRPVIGWVMLAPLLTSAHKREVLTFAWIALFAAPVGLFAGRGGLLRRVGYILLLATGVVVPALVFHTTLPTAVELAVLAVSEVAGAIVASVVPRWPRRVLSS